jgi:ubiquinone biosynthesis protein COQ9
MVMRIMKKQTDHIQIKFDLIKAMIHHVPFDGWSIDALEQGAIDIGFKQKETYDTRMEIYKDLFKNGSIEFIDIFSEMIDLEVKNNYEKIDPKPEKVPEKVKKIILMRLSLCQKYKEAIRSSIPITALPKNSKKSIGLLYRTCNSIWRIIGDKSTDFSFYTKRVSLAAVYSSTLLFWLNDTSKDQEETSLFLDRRLSDISKIPKLKRPFSLIKKISNNINITNSTFKIKSVVDVLKKFNQTRNSGFS